MNSTKKTKNKIFATDAAPTAMPPKPNTAATKAITKKTAAQYNMIQALLKTYGLRISFDLTAAVEKHKACPSVEKLAITLELLRLSGEASGWSHVDL